MTFLLYRNVNYLKKYVTSAVLLSSTYSKVPKSISSVACISKCNCSNVKHLSRFPEQFYNVGNSKVIFQHVKPLLVLQLSRSYAKKSKKEKGGKGGSKLQPKVELSQDDLNSVINFGEYKHELENVIGQLKQDYVDRLTLRTTAGALDNLLVDTSEGKFPMIQIAQIVQKNPSLYVVDLITSPQYVTDAKKAIENSLNINPQQEKTTLFVTIPKVTREHRETLAKNAKGMFNQTKEKLGHVYKNYHKKVRKQKDSHSADLIKNLDEIMQITMKKHIQEAEAMMKLKQDEILSGQ